MLNMVIIMWTRKNIFIIKNQRNALTSPIGCWHCHYIDWSDQNLGDVINTWMVVCVFLSHWTAYNTQMSFTFFACVIYPNLIDGLSLCTNVMLCDDEQMNEWQCLSKEVINKSVSNTKHSQFSIQLRFYLDELKCVVCYLKAESTQFTWIKFCKSVQFCAIAQKANKQKHHRVRFIRWEKYMLNRNPQNMQRSFFSLFIHFGIKTKNFSFCIRYLCVWFCQAISR